MSQVLMKDYLNTKCNHNKELSRGTALPFIPRHHSYHCFMGLLGSFTEVGIFFGRLKKS